MMQYYAAITMVALAQLALVAIVLFTIFGCATTACPKGFKVNEQGGRYYIASDGYTRLCQ